MGYSVWDGLADVLTSGGYSTGKKLYGTVSGKKNDNLVDTALDGLNLKIENVLDPGNLLWSSEQQKLAEDQFKYEKKWNEKNYEEQKRQYEQNYAAELEAYNYQKSLNALQMEREDMAVQRRVADLEAAGLSPTLAAGSAASVQPVHAGVAPHMEPAQMQTASAIKVQAAMFKEQMMKERIGLAMSMLGNMADVSRTKAETEFIKAQKDRYVAETPVDMRIKSELAELNEQLHSIRVDQAKQNLTNSEADYISKLWDHVAASDDHILKTTKAVREELGVKLDEQALRIGASEENIKKTEALIKGIALQLEEYQLKTEKQLQDFYGNLGVPRGVHDKPAYAPFTLIRGLVDGLDKGGTWLWNKAKSGLSKLPVVKK